MAATEEQMKALSGLVHIVALATNDVVGAGEATVMSAVGKASFGNVFEAIFSFLPIAGDLLQQRLAPQDYAQLIIELAETLVIPQAHAAGIVNAALGTIAAIIPPLVQLHDAIKAAPAPAPTAAA